MVVFAVLTGRTLVLPPRKQWYLLGDKKLCFGDFFDLKALAQLVPVLTWDEYAAYKKKHGLADTDRTLVRLMPMRHVVAYPSIQAVRQYHSEAKVSMFTGPDPHPKPNPNRKVNRFTGPDRKLADFTGDNAYLLEHDEVPAAL